MKITLIAVGKIKEKFYRDAVSEYTKRLSRYCKLQVIEIQDEKTPDGASEAVENQIKDKEGDKILTAIKDNSYVIALAIDGKEYSSVNLSEHVSKLAINGNSNITLIIGGSLGLSDKVLKMVNEKISFSKMTFPHQLMRVILLEQIYRTYRIINNEPYHK